MTLADKMKTKLCAIIGCKGDAYGRLDVCHAHYQSISDAKTKAIEKSRLLDENNSPLQTEDETMLE